MLSLLRLERKQNNSSNPFLIRIFFFFSYSFGIQTIKTFVHSRSSLKNHTRFQTKMGKVYTCIQTKRRKNPTLCGGTYLYSLYKGISPPGTIPFEELNAHKTVRKPDMVGSEGFLSFLKTCCQQAFGRAGNWGAGNFPFRLLAIFFPKQRACSQAKFLGKMKFQVCCRRGLYRLTRGGVLISLSRRIKVYPGGYLRNFWVGMCRWVPGTLSLYQSSFK